MIKITKNNTQEQSVNMTKMIPLNSPDMNNDDTIYADNHSLFIDKQAATLEPVRDENQNIVEGYFEQIPEYTVYKLFIGDFMENGNGIQRIINKLQSAGNNDVLEFHISSHGGVISELIEIYNICDTLFHGRVTTYCNFGYSAGAMAFLFGTDRLVYEHSDWMMHSYSGGFGGKRQDLLDHMAHEDKKLQRFFADLMAPYFTKKEISKIQKGKDFWLNSEQLLERGIATHIMIHGELQDAQTYLETLYPKRKVKREKQEKKNAKQEAKILKQLDKEQKQNLKNLMDGTTNNQSKKNKNKTKDSK